VTLPSAQKLYAVIDGTWPASAKQAVGPWIVRLDNSGSSRVAAATAELPITPNDIEPAANAMLEAGQRPLFMIREGDESLDQMLEQRGYRIKDPVNMYAVPVAELAQKRPPPVTTFEVWPPLAIQHEIWSAGGIGAGRLAIMDRARPPKVSILGRVEDTPAGSAYVGKAGDCAMIHGLEVAVDFRRQGLAANLMRAAAFWAQDQGVTFLTLVTTQDNVAANALYTSLGMTNVGQYHYRVLME